MLEYHAILYKKYKIPIKQYVLFIGKGQHNMREEIEPEGVFTGFKTLDIKNLNLTDILSTELPQELVFAILTDFEDNPAPKALQYILTRLDEICGDSILNEKYIKQLSVLSKLRNLQLEIKKIITAMPIEFNIKEDWAYQEGRKELAEELKQIESKYELLMAEMEARFIAEQKEKEAKLLAEQKEKETKLITEQKEKETQLITAIQHLCTSTDFSPQKIAEILSCEVSFVETIKQEWLANQNTDTNDNQQTK